ncbi:hypothetical protein D9M68_720280 [compost metagenome]
MTLPTMPSKLSMKLLIQRPMSPVSSFDMREVSRRWRKLPSPSAMVRTSSVISCRRAARRRGPKLRKYKAPQPSRPACSRYSQSSGRPL